jgi:transposase
VDRLQAWLEEDRDLPGVEPLRRAQEAGYRGGKSALYELVRRLRPSEAVPLGRFEGVAGEFSQHDFGHVDVRYTGARLERVHGFASRLKWSRVAHVSLVPDEQEEAVVRHLLAALETFGGIPLVAVFDNPKTVVLSRQEDLIVWNPVFGPVALDSRFAPELCWPRAGQHKGAVENLVGGVKGSFFKCRRFHDRADLERQRAEWLTLVNTQRPNRATGVIPTVRLAQARARLRPLPIPPAADALKLPVVDTARGRVSHDGRDYSTPPTTIGQPATLHPQGLGKTMIAQNIAHQAVLAGHHVLFTSTAQILLDLGSQESARGLARRPNYYGQRGLLVLDERGYLSCDARRRPALPGRQPPVRRAQSGAHDERGLLRLADHLPQRRQRDRPH